MNSGPPIKNAGRGSAGGRLPWHVLDHVEVESGLGTSARGLARVEAAARLDRHGPNQLEEAPPPSAWAVLLHQFTSPLIYILLVATFVTLLLREYADALVIAVVLALNALIGFTQERKAERSVRGLMHLVAPHARVIREGREWDVEGRELVPGDLVLLESGGRVPADLRLGSATALLVDESLFTGESVPVAKMTARLDQEDLVIGDRT
ncbi:MAG: ATPase, partial [Candidatus Rokubacteria bacterium]|nr:ATPase [Candidatus Rokubacteria bacterium]